MAAKEGPSCDGSSKLSDHEFNLISQSNEEFNKTKYEECLETLAQLETSLGNNVRIQHNRAIVEFYKSDCKDHSGLLQKLENLNVAQIDDAKCKETSHIATYNKALLYFAKSKMMTAFETLSPLLEKRDDLDTSTSAAVSMLMLSLLLATNQINRAQALLESIQTQLGLNIETLVSDGNFAPDSLVGKEGFSHQFKILALLTHVLNKKAVVVPEDGTLEMSAVKAHQYYIMKDFQMAAKQLRKMGESSCTPESRRYLDTCIANNMGIIHLRVRNYAIAAQFFQNAINFEKVIASNIRQTTLQQLGLVRTREILYNLGIAMLHLRRPQEAFKCFLVPLKTYHSNPRLWLRVAETCIMDYEMKCAEFKKYPHMAKNIAKQKIMFKLHDQTVTPSEPSLEFAVNCLRSALALVTIYINELNSSTNPSNAEKEAPMKDANFCHPSVPVTSEALGKMLAAIYAAYSYVSIRIGDYVTAHELAQELLKLITLSDSHKMLAHMYIAESLTKMDRLREATPHLDPTFVTTLNALDFETKNWQIKSVDAAQAVVRYNLVIVLLLQGNYDLARNMLYTCTHPSTALKVATLKKYLDA